MVVLCVCHMAHFATARIQDQQACTQSPGQPGCEINRHVPAPHVTAHATKHMRMRLDSTRKVLSHGMCASNMTESGTPGNNSRQLRHITGTQAHRQVSSHTMEVGHRGLRTKVRRDEAGEFLRVSEQCRRRMGLTWRSDMTPCSFLYGEGPSA